MSEPKGYLKSILDLGNLLVLVALLIAAYQIWDTNKSNIENSVNQEMSYTLNLLLPCWEQWKVLYFDTRELEDFDSDFLARASIAQDRWPATLMNGQVETKDTLS